MFSSVAPEESLLATSAGGALNSTRAPMTLGVLLTVGMATSNAYATPVGVEEALCAPLEQTSSGVPIPVPDEVGAGVSELRRLSGLTWEQLARLIGVSRRSLHFWASGKPTSRVYEERLQRLLATMRLIDRGSARSNRAMMLTPGPDGNSPLDLLADDQHEPVVALLGPGGARRVRPPKISPAVLAERAPLGPEDLLSGLPERIHRETGGSRRARSVKVPGGREG